MGSHRTRIANRTVKIGNWTLDIDTSLFLNLARQESAHLRMP